MTPVVPVEWFAPGLGQSLAAQVRPYVLTLDEADVRSTLAALVAIREQHVAARRTEGSTYRRRNGRRSHDLGEAEGRTSGLQIAHESVFRALATRAGLQPTRAGLQPTGETGRPPSLDELWTFAHLVGCYWRGYYGGLEHDDQPRYAPCAACGSQACHPTSDCACYVAPSEPGGATDAGGEAAQC